uniref:ZZ-type domain-containing protein n=1 Tax=Romanomermis culicivorax TaxID=13658 RepID=A0A915JN30_ROMCU
MSSATVNLHRLQNCAVSVKVYFGETASSYEIRRFIFKSDQPKASSCTGIYEALLEKIRALYHGLNLKDLHLCWKDDDGDYVVFSSDDELKVAINSVTDNTLRIYIREKELSFCAPDSNTPGGNKYSKKKVLANNNHRTSKSKERATCLSTNHNRQGRESRVITINHSQPIRLQGRQPLVCNNDVIINQEESLYQTPPGTSTDMASFGNSTSVVPESSDCTPSALYCNQCRGEGRGVWYKCTVCQDFLLCSDCENRGLHDHHIMVRLTNINDQQNLHNDYANSRLYTYPYHYKR